MVVGHQGNQNVWGLTEEFLPEWANREELTEEDYESQAARRAILALGTALPREINYYFVRGRYRNLKRTLSRLHEEGIIHRVKVEGFVDKEERYVHRDDVRLLESMDGSAWQPRTSLIAPFDNLIAGRERTKRVFDFDYVHEQFFPKEKRKFGTYVLPILWGDRLIGRLDPQLDKRKARLLINSVHSEPGAPNDNEVAREIRDAIERLATFIGAKEIVYTRRVPYTWRGILR
jgi:uncharacterized protein YcaQ